MDIEPNISELSTKFIDRNFSRIEKFAQSRLGALAAKIRTALPNTFKSFLEKQGNRYGTCKSFFIRNDSAFLYNFYVPIGITHSNKTISNPTFSDLQGLSHKILVTGLAGSGKSMFMRHLLLSTLECAENLPIFVELRDAIKSEPSVVSILNEVFSRNGMSYGKEFVSEVIKQDNLNLVLIFDGFDELPRAKQEALASDLLKFDTNSSCSIVLSSRPDYAFSGWHSFLEVKINPLERDESEILISKLPFDQDIQKSFIKDLKAGDFDDHKSFLANPLLLSIMLLTYGENADIPSKASLFYKQAYEALFHRHDALKAGFKRERLTNLDVEEFSRVFSAFCLFSYDDNKYIFTRSESLNYIRQAIDQTQIEVDAEDFLEDSLRAVNLLIEDGLSIIFSHRSFQEYFVARFIDQTDAVTQKGLLELYKYRTNVIRFVFEINRRVVEVGVYLPILNTLFSASEMSCEISEITLNDIVKFINYLEAEVTVEKNRIFISIPNSTSSLMNGIALIFENIEGIKNELIDVDVSNLMNYPNEGVYSENKLTKKITELLDDRCFLFSITSIKRLLSIKRELEEKEEKRDESLHNVLGFLKESSKGEL